jgi:hypothetical protein
MMLAGAEQLSNFFYLIGLRVGGFFVLLLDRDVNFFAMDFGFTRRFYSKANLTPLDRNNDDLDVVVNRDTLSELPGKY